MPKTIYRKLERIDDFLESLRLIRRSDEKAIWGLCLSELRHLKKDWWLPYGVGEPQQGYRLTTLRSVLTRYRNRIREVLGERHRALDFLRPSDNDQRTNQRRYNGILVDQHRNLRPLDCDAMVETATAILRRPQRGANARFDIQAALCALTGRRGWEIAVVGDFSERRGRLAKILSDARGHTLVFSGQAKTRGAASARTKPYEIPVLTDPELVLYAFRNLHEHYPLRKIPSLRAYNGYEGKRVSARAKRLFADASMPRNKPLNAHDLRAAYATTAYAWYGPVTVTQLQFSSFILGHSPLDTQAAISYFRFHPLHQKREALKDYRTSIRDELTALQRLREKEKADRAKLLDQRMKLFRDSLAPQPKKPVEPVT